MDDLSNVMPIYLMLVLVWLIVAVFLFISIMKRQDMKMPMKILWCAVILLAPLVGLMIYLVYNYYIEKRV